MPIMSDLRFTKAASVRTHDRIQRRFKCAVLEAAEDEGLKFDDDAEPTMENVTAAMWLWFAHLDTADAQKFLRVMYPRLADFLRGREIPASEPLDPEEPSEVGGPPEPPVPVRRRKV